MEQDERDEPRALNDSRKRPSTPAARAIPVAKKPTLGDRWRNAQPTKSTLLWACLATAILTMVVGFTWGGWVSASGAQKAAETMANDAVVQRLAPICIAQFNLDPDKSLKLDELTGMTSNQRARYVQDQGWATISGDEQPNRKVADACTKLLLEMSP